MTRGTEAGGDGGNWERRVQLAAHPLAYPLVRALALVGPVVRVPRVGVVVSDATLARAVLTDTAAFTKTGPGSPADLWTPVVGPSVLLNMEGAEHAELRRRLADLFTPRAVADLVARSSASLTIGRPLDVVALTRQLAGAVIAELVGLDPDLAAAPAFAAATAVTGQVRLARPRLTPSQVARARAALAELTEPADVAYRAGDPVTVPGRMRSLGLSEDESRGAVAAFVLTGTETLVSFVPRLVALLFDTGWLDRLAVEPSRADDVIGEALRVTVPSPVMLRSVSAPARIGTLAVRPGERVVISTVSAARALGGFDPDRPHPPHLRRLWFGAGPHFCLGMPLAMAEIHTVLDAVLAAHRDRPWRIVRRRAARGVLVPAYRELVLDAA
ncbi:cytochrome P450 [Pseudonocardia hierapolitana]|uniref:Cytochrome P450 n=1 Tax=Pseudonocardia hierapolitana TaxID=1128676 RepID=A0A561SP23_9PSEU|nr:cytochrome P450 [Pseudonocardia hierapolitana]TWF76618.1 cytochrome P450 [Pseudonocardia hierapolitana]